MFNERVLTSEEEDIVLMASIEHEPTNERRFASRAFMERWLGIEGTHFSTALQSTCPCSRWILPVTGEAAEETALGESCGATRYCLGCEDVFATLSLVPAMHIVCPLVASVFSAGLRDWRSGCTSLCNSRFDQPASQLQCTMSSKPACRPVDL